MGTISLITRCSSITEPGVRVLVHTVTSCLAPWMARSTGAVNSSAASPGACQRPEPSHSSTAPSGAHPRWQ